MITGVIGSDRKAVIVLRLNGPGARSEEILHSSTPASQAL
jgi:hypothetical protein